MKTRGKFITFEGMEGVGKSTQLRAVAQHLENQGLRVFVTREPGGTPLGNDIRALLLQSRDETIVPLAELFLLEAARAQHVQMVLRPALQKYDVVLCDRFTDASLAYQGGGRGMKPALVSQLNQLASDRLVPHVVVLLDMKPKQAIGRAMVRIEASSSPQREDRFERERIAFHRRVREGYLSLARKNPNRFFVVDAAGKQADITRTILSRILPALKKRRS